MLLISFTVVVFANETSSMPINLPRNPAIRPNGDKEWNADGYDDYDLRRFPFYGQLPRLI